MIQINLIVQLYESGVISLGRAAELAGLDLVSFKRILHERGIIRAAHEPVGETAEMARMSLAAAGRSA